MTLLPSPPPLGLTLIARVSSTCQDKVFGAGYPGVPTMTQEEFLEKEIMEGKVVLDYKE